METYSLLVVTLLASLGFLAFAAKMALVTGIAFLPVAAYLALLVVFFVAAICLAASRSYHIAHGEQLLTACQAEASEERQSTASTIKSLKRQLATIEAMLDGERRDRDFRLQDISARNRSHLQEIAGLHAILKQARSESVDSRKVEIAMRIERQWSLLRDIMVEGGIKATTEQEWQRAVTELVQRKPSTSTPIGVVSGDLKTARDQLAKEIYDNKTAQLKAQRLEHSLDAARLTVDILNNDLEQSRADNGAKQRNIDHLRQQLDAEQKKECGGEEEKTSKWKRMLANTEKQCKKEHSRFLEATGKFQAEKRTVSQRDKNITQRDDEIKSLHNNIFNTNAQKEQLQKKLNDSQATEEQKGKDLEQAQRRIKEQEDKISELDSRLTKETKEKVTLTNDLKNVRTELSSEQINHFSTQSALTSTQVRLNELERNATNVSQLENQISEMKTQAESALTDRIAQVQQEKEDQATALKARITELESTIDIKDGLMVQYEGEIEQLKQQLNNALQPLGNANTALPTSNDPTRWTPQSFAQYMDTPVQEFDPQLFNPNSNFTQEEIDQTFSSSAFNSNYTQEEIDQTFSSSALDDPSLTGNSSFPTYTGGATTDDAEFNFDDFINNDQAEGFQLDVSDIDFSALVDFNNSTSLPAQVSSSNVLPAPQGRKRRAPGA